MNRKKLLARLSRGQLRNVAFSDMTNLARGFGFEIARISGSHHVFQHPTVPKRSTCKRSAARRSRIRSTVSSHCRASQSAIGERRMKDYHINIFYSEEDEGYIADVPDLECCSAFGAYARGGLTELEKAKTAWLQAARTAGRPIPLPAYRPAIYQAVP